VGDVFVEVAAHLPLHRLLGIALLGHVPAWTAAVILILGERATRERGSSFLSAA